MIDPLDIPDFLRVTPASIEEERNYWKGRKRTIQGSGFKHKVTKVEEAATRQLRREVEAAAAAKKEARFAALRALRSRK